MPCKLHSNLLLDVFSRRCEAWRQYLVRLMFVIYMNTFFIYSQTSKHCWGVLVDVPRVHSENCVYFWWIRFSHRKDASGDKLGLLNWNQTVLNGIFFGQVLKLDNFNPKWYIKNDLCRVLRSIPTTHSIKYMIFNRIWAILIHLHQIIGFPPRKLFTIGPFFVVFLHTRLRLMMVQISLISMWDEQWL